MSSVVDQLSALEDSRRDGDLSLPNGDRLRVTNLAKVFWPALGITKGELLRYYVQASTFLLPAVDDRPLVMIRKRRRRACGVKSCPTTSIRSPKRVLATASSVDH